MYFVSFRHYLFYICLSTFVGKDGRCATLDGTGYYSISECLQKSESPFFRELSLRFRKNLVFEKPTLHSLESAKGRNCFLISSERERIRLLSTGIETEMSWRYRISFFNHFEPFLFEFLEN